MKKNNLIILIPLFFLIILLGIWYFGKINLSSKVFLSGNIFDTKSFVTIFVGDIMLDRAVAVRAQKDGKESVFEGVKDILKNVDAVIGNLEGTVSTRSSIAVPGSSVLRFTFDPNFMPILYDLGFKAVSLANNHSLDFGYEGDQESRDYLHTNDILTFGAALNDKELSSSLATKDGSFCLVGYHDLFSPDPTAVLEEIKNIRPTCQQVIVFVHWGSEYTHIPSERQRILAQSFIDAGADLIIGAHPHVVQPIEIYNDKAIFYSLGNFVFDQNFSFDTMHGLLLQVEWGSSLTNFELIPIAISNGKVNIADQEAREKILKMLVNENTSKDIASSIVEVGAFAIK